MFQNRLLLEREIGKGKSLEILEASESIWVYHRLAICVAFFFSSNLLFFYQSASNQACRFFFCFCFILTIVFLLSQYNTLHNMPHIFPASLQVIMYSILFLKIVLFVFMYLRNEQCIWYPVRHQLIR
jgi:hypothetical protein